MRRLIPMLIISFAIISVVRNVATAAVTPRLDHVVVIMLENHSDRSVVGDPAAPTITRYAHKYAYAANFYGVTHPSLPNYVAITSGNTWYSNSDDPTQRFAHWNLVDELEAAKVSWKAYMQGLPTPGFTGNFYPSDENRARYVIRHDPFMLYDDVRDNAARRAKVVPLRELAGDARGGTLPRFIWISPDVCKDMHGTPDEPCPYAKDAALRRSGDDFIKRWVPRLLRAKGWTRRSVIFILTDETTYTGNPATDGWLSAQGCCDSPVLPAGTKLLPKGGVYGGGKIPFIAIGEDVKRKYVSQVAYNHYSLLRTIEDAWGLERLGVTSDIENIRSLSDLFEVQK
jgi:hypothetical protein